MADRIYKLSEDKRRYHREKMAGYRALKRSKLPKPEPKPEPEKPNRALRQKDPKSYHVLYMRWYRKNGQVRGLDPEGKDWWK